VLKTNRTKELLTRMPQTQEGLGYPIIRKEETKILAGELFLTSPQIGPCLQDRHKEGKAGTNLLRCNPGVAMMDNGPAPLHHQKAEVEALLGQRFVRKEVRDEDKAIEL
jgi:hypothetical protein